MSNDKIKIETSIPGLKDKIKIDIADDYENVYWYIRFNIPLDPLTVSHHTMSVTDTMGYIMRTDISYSKKKNSIVVSPQDTYEQNRYYLLNISRYVKSAGGKNLRSEIHILFKLLNNQISEFKMLDKNVEVPKPKPRPRNYEEILAKESKPVLFPPVGTEGEKLTYKVTADRLPYADLKVNIIIGLGGVVMTIVSSFLQNTTGFTISLSVCLLGILHIILQLNKKENKSSLYYNWGIIQFNSGNYKKAYIAFKKAVKVSRENELATFALKKVRFYL